MRIAPPFPCTHGSLGWSVPEHVVVVVSEEREDLARRQLAPFGAVTLVPQPAHRGTGPGILLPLTRVLAADPDAHVVVLPSDQLVRRSSERLALRTCASDVRRTKLKRLATAWQKIPARAFASPETPLLHSQTVLGVFAAVALGCANRL